MADYIEIRGRLAIPDKEPYEGKATQKQKQRIWELGFRDQGVIDSLGKKQASAVIDQLCGAYQNAGRKISTKRFFRAGSFLLIASIGTMVAGRFWHAARESDLAAAVIVFGFLGGITALFVSLFLWASTRKEKDG